MLTPALSGVCSLSPRNPKEMKPLVLMSVIYWASYLILSLLGKGDVLSNKPSRGEGWSGLMLWKQFRGTTHAASRSWGRQEEPTPWESSCGSVSVPNPLRECRFPFVLTEIVKAMWDYLAQADSKPQHKHLTLDCASHLHHLSLSLRPQVASHPPVRSGPGALASPLLVFSCVLHRPTFLPSCWRNTLVLWGPFCLGL